MTASGVHTQRAEHVLIPSRGKAMNLCTRSLAFFLCLAFAPSHLLCTEASSWLAGASRRRFEQRPSCYAQLLTASAAANGAGVATRHWPCLLHVHSHSLPCRSDRVTKLFAPLSTHLSNNKAHNVAAGPRSLSVDPFPSENRKFEAAIRFITRTH